MGTIELPQIMEVLMDISVNITEDRKIQAENQRIQAENQRIQATQFNQFVKKQNEFNEIIVAKLDKIERNIIIIKDKVISDFENMSESTKVALERTATLAVEDPEVIELDNSLRSGITVIARSPKTGKNVRKVYETFPVKQIHQDLGLPKEVKLIPLGSYVSSIVTKLFGHNFSGKYPIGLQPFIENLVLYHQTERESRRQY